MKKGARKHLFLFCLFGRRLEKLIEIPKAENYKPDSYYDSKSRILGSPVKGRKAIRSIHSKSDPNNEIKVISSCRSTAHVLRLEKFLQRSF